MGERDIVRKKRLPGGAQPVQFFGLDAEVRAGAIRVAAGDGGGLDGSVGRALFAVAEALAAIGVEQVGGGQVAPTRVGRTGTSASAIQPHLTEGPRKPDQNRRRAGEVADRDGNC
jgi:hypothetical protein